MRILTLLILFFAAAVHAAPKVTTLVSSNHVAVNEAFTYQVQVVLPADNQMPRVKAPSFPSQLPLRATPFRMGTSTQRSYSVINGQMTDNSSTTISITCQIVPLKEGTLRIPSLTFFVNEEEVTSKALEIKVSKESSGSRPEGIQFTQELSARRTVPGRPVDLTYRFTFPQSLEVQGIVPDLNIQQLAAYFQIPDSFNPRDWDQRRTIVNGVPKVEISLTVPLMPKSTGNFTLPEVAMQLTVPDERQSRHSRQHYSPFGFDDFFSRGPTRDLVFTAKSCTLEVQPLPQAGQPADFSGIIGPLTATATAEPTAVSVGDPIVLTITLRGPTALQLVRLPDLKHQSALVRDFKVTGDDPGQIAGDAVTFQRTIRATRAGELVIPALKIPYYDLEKETYATAETAPIPVTVAAARQITLSDATGNGAHGAASSAPAAPAATALNSAADGLSPNRPPQELLAPVVTSRGRKLWLIVPPTLWAILLLIKLTTLAVTANPAVRAARRAKGQLLSELGRLDLNAADAGQRLNGAWQHFWISRLQLPPGAVTYNDVCRSAVGQRLTPQQKERLATIFTTCEAAYYGGTTTTDLAGLRQLIEAAMKDLPRC